LLPDEACTTTGAAEGSSGGAGCRRLASGLVDAKIIYKRTFLHWKK